MDDSIKLGPAPKTVQEMLERWRVTLKIRAMAHYLSAEKYKKLGWKVGIPHTIVSGVATLSFFTTPELGEPYDLIVRIVGGALGSIATIMNGMNMVFSFPKISTDHEASANQFSGLLRGIEMMQILDLDTENEMHMEQIQTVSEKYQEILRTCPTIAINLLNFAQNAVLKEEKILDSYAQREKIETKSEKTKKIK